MKACGFSISVSYVVPSMKYAIATKTILCSIYNKILYEYQIKPLINNSIRNQSQTGKVPYAFFIGGAKGEIIFYFS
jgi:hypothetical protein